MENVIRKGKKRRKKHNHDNVDHQQGFKHDYAKAAHTHTQTHTHTHTHTHTYVLSNILPCCLCIKLQTALIPHVCDIMHLLCNTNSLHYIFLHQVLLLKGEVNQRSIMMGMEFQKYTCSSFSLDLLSCLFNKTTTTTKTKCITSQLILHLIFTGKETEWTNMAAPSEAQKCDGKPLLYLIS